VRARKEKTFTSTPDACLSGPRHSRHCFKRSRRPVARTARRSIAARTDASDPTTCTLSLARVTAV
jgi:hypothetical protein